MTAAQTAIGQSSLAAPSRNSPDSIPFDGRSPNKSGKAAPPSKTAAPVYTLGPAPGLPSPNRRTNQMSALQETAWTTATPGSPVFPGRRCVSNGWPAADPPDDTPAVHNLRPADRRRLPTFPPPATSVPPFLPCHRAIPPPPLVPAVAAAVQTDPNSLWPANEVPVRP